MPRVEANHPDARFCVTARSDEFDEAGADTYFTSQAESKGQFDLLVSGRRFYSVVRGRWADGKWLNEEEWPDDLED